MKAEESLDVEEQTLSFFLLWDKESCALQPLHLDWKAWSAGESPLHLCFFHSLFYLTSSLYFRSKQGSCRSCVVSTRPKEMFWICYSISKGTRGLIQLLKHCLRAYGWGPAHRWRCSWCLHAHHQVRLHPCKLSMIFHYCQRRSNQCRWWQWLGTSLTPTFDQLILSLIFRGCNGSSVISSCGDTSK